MDHVAIDRLSGGAANKLKFDDQPLIGTPSEPLVFTGKFWVHTDLNAEEQQALRQALEALRDGLATLGAKGSIGYGWISALRVCQPSLRLALGIGSWAGHFGNRHQAHYSAANALLAALSEELPDSIRGVVAEFGPWSSSEMARDIPLGMRHGLEFIADTPGLNALLQDLASGSGPLLHGRTPPLHQRSISLDDHISTDSHPYLRDHVIAGVPVMPLAAAADMLAQAAAPPLPFSLENLLLFQGITVQQPIDVQARARAEHSEIKVGEQHTTAYRARVRHLVDAEIPADPGPLHNGQPATLSLEEFYDKVTFHGPRLQGISAIDGQGPGFVRGRVRTSRPKDWIPGCGRPNWTIDPLALDGAMQICAHLAWTRFQRAGTPSSIGRYVQLHPFPEGEVIVEVTFDEDSIATRDQQDRFSGSFRFRDSQGRLLALAEDVVAELRQAGQDDAHPGDAHPDDDEEPTQVGLQAQASADAPFVPLPEDSDPALWPEVKQLHERLVQAGEAGLRNPYFAVHQGVARDTTRVDGRELINFSSYNYLGLSGDPRLLADVCAAVARYGTSVSASRVASGERPFHSRLEGTLAASQEAEAALLFTAGHATNVSTIGHLFGPKDLILHDELIHDSILQGIKLAGSARRAFRHDDATHLALLLATLRPHHRKVLIVVEGVYSMDGDLCDLPAFVALKEQHGCLLMVDEAHSFGVVGPTGLGVREHYDLDGSRVDIWMGTLSKSLASCGGWIAGSRTLVDYLRYTTPGFVFSAGLTPANGQAALSALRLMQREPWRVQKLQSNARFFHERLAGHGLDTGPAMGASGVVPVITGNSMVALLEGQGDFCTGYGSPPLPPSCLGCDFHWDYGMDPELWIWDRWNNDLFPEAIRGTCVDLRRAAGKLGTYGDTWDVVRKIGVLATVGPVPNDCIAFSPGFPKDIMDKLVEAIKEHIASEEGHALWSDPNFYEWDEVAEIDDSYYCNYRDLLGYPNPPTCEGK